MPLALTDVDSPILTDAQSSFIGGQFSNAAAIQLDETTCALLENAEESTTGQIYSRRGTVRLGGDVGTTGRVQILDYYRTSVYDYAIAGTSSAGIFRLNGNNWQELTAGHPPTGVITTAVGNGYLYAATGIGTIRRWDGTTWVICDGAGGAGHTTGDTAPTDVSILLWDGFRLIASGQSSAPDAVYFSGLLADNLWAGLGGGYQLQPGGGDGEAIVAIKAWTGSNLAVLKRGSTWVIGADPKLFVSDMPVQRVHKRIGCIAANSAHQCGDDILFLSNDLTVRSLQQTVASNDQWELGQPLSFPIQDILRRINPAAASKAAGIFWNSRYYLSVALDASSTNNYIVIYNTITKKWSGGWSGLPVSYFAVRNVAGQDRLFMGISTGKSVIELLDYVSDTDATDQTYRDYTGLDVPFRFVSRSFIFGDFDSPKKGLNMTMKLNKSKGPVSVTAILDEGKYLVSKTIDTGITAPLNFPITFPAFFPRLGVQPASFSLRPFPRFNQIQFEVKSTSPGRKEVRALTVQAFPEALDLRGQFIARTFEVQHKQADVLVDPNARITTDGDIRITTDGDTRIIAAP